MAGGRVERRLAAILAADVAGYSRLIGADEEGTLARLRTLRRELVDPAIAEHQGRIVKTTGDGLLVDFHSVVDAVRCAVEVQRAMIERNANEPADTCVEFRIGIHQGDIVVEDDDIFGDGVNIAARLEALAEPGGICVSARVMEDAAGRLDLGFEDMGEPELKNIARKVRVYRVLPQYPHPNPPPLAGEGADANPPPLAGEGADADPPPHARGGAQTNPPPQAGEGRVGVSAAPLPLPDKPSVAVLPFANMSSDPEQEFLADGIAEDVITALSRYPSLFVIARNSCFTYKGRAVEVRQVGRELGVRYVLEGSLRKAGSRIRVTAQLVEAATGNHVWAERYDRDLADIFAVQDEISQAATIAIAPAIAQAELQRAIRKPPQNLDAWAAYQRGWWHISQATGDDTQRAHDFFERAVALDPGFAGGYIGLASAISAAATAFATAALAEVQSTEESLARQAIALDPSNAEAYVCLAVALRDRGDLAGALAEAERAITLCPNLAAAHGRKGQALVFSGRPRDGITSIETALRSDPRSPVIWRELQYLTIGRYLCCEYEAAIAAAEQVIRLYPDFRLPYHWLAAAFGQLGRSGEGEAALNRAIALSAAQGVGLTRTASSFGRLPWMRPNVTAHLLEGLRKAGWEG